MKTKSDTSVSVSRISPSQYTRLSAAEHVGLNSPGTGKSGRKLNDDVVLVRKPGARSNSVHHSSLGATGKIEQQENSFLIDIASSPATPIEGQGVITTAIESRILYITWDGPQVSYLEGLFLPIFVGLKAYGIAIHVLQFTWDAEKQVTSRVEACKSAGKIPYECVTVARGFGGLGAYATAWLGGRKIDELVDRWSIDGLMPRCIMPSVAIAHSRTGAKLPCVFDADGLAVDERVDFGGLNRQSFTYHLLKSYERRMITRAQSVIGRTAEACSIYQTYDYRPSKSKYFVSVNGRDPFHFQTLSKSERNTARFELGLPQAAPIILHNGSFGSKYCPEVELSLVTAIKKLRKDAVFLVLTGQLDAASNFFAQHSRYLPQGPVIKRLTYDDMARALAACDLGLCLYRDTFSNKAFQSTKLGEFLLSGVPVVATPNAMLREMVGLPSVRSIGSMSEAEIKATAEWFVEEALPNRDSYGAHARAFGLQYLTVDKSIHSYTQIDQDRPKDSLKNYNTFALH